MPTVVIEPIINLARWARREYDLRGAWTLIEAAHTPGLQYHNLMHLEIVTGAAVLLALRDGFNPKIAAIAAMFHDCGHTGTQPDAQNIEQALMWFNIWHERVANPVSEFGLPSASSLSEEHVAMIQQAIACTEYCDGDFPNKPDTVLDRILRDADLWNPHLRRENCEYMVKGLAREMKVRMSPRGFFLKQVAWFGEQKWYTKHGQHLSSSVNQRLMVALGLEPDDDDDDE